MEVEKFKELQKKFNNMPVEERKNKLLSIQSELEQELTSGKPAAGVVEMQMGNIIGRLAKLSKGQQRSDYFNQALEYCHKATDLLNPWEHFLLMENLLNRGGIYSIIANESPLLARPEYYELAIDDFRTLILEAQKYKDKSHLALAINNMGVLSVSLANITKPEDSIVTLREAKQHLQTLDVFGSSSLVDILPQATYYLVTALIAILTDKNLGLTMLEACFNQIEHLATFTAITENPHNIIRILVPVADKCLLWNMLNSKDYALLERARRILDTLKNDVVYRNLPEYIDVLVMDYEYCRFRESLNEEMLNFFPIFEDEIKNNLSPMDRPILFARATLMRAWKQSFLQDSAFASTARKAILTLWPGYAPNASIPYPKGCICHYIIQTALNIMAGPGNEPV